MGKSKKKQPTVIKILLSNTDDVYATVDEEDYFLLALWKYTWRWKWSFDPHVRYVATNAYDEYGKRHTLYLHRLIMGLTNGENMEVDHLDENPANNCRYNLEIVTPEENKKRIGTRGIKKDEVPF